MNNIDITKIDVGGQALARYKDLDYEVWFALAEFIDNSLHAFLIQENEENSKCQVVISHNEDELNIFDNAGGIPVDQFNRLLSIGQKKDAAEKQLSKFGMGMKTAGIWLADFLLIETKSTESLDCYRISVDIGELRKGNEEYVSILKCVPSSSLNGYTKITLSKLHRNITRRTLSKTKESIGSIYKRYIEQNLLEVRWNDEAIVPLQFELMHDANGVRRMDFSIEITDAITGAKKHANGWVGELAVGNGAKAGFYVYQHDRQIHGYPDNTFKPSTIFGNERGSNTLVNQRLVGEINMEDFDVAHTKNKILFTGNDKDMFEEDLRKKCNTIIKLAQQTGNRSKSAKENEQTSSIAASKSEITDWMSNNSSLNISPYKIVKESAQEESKKIIHSPINDNKIKWIDQSIKMDNLEFEIDIYNITSDNMFYMHTNFILESQILEIYVNQRHTYVSYIMAKSTSDYTDFVINCIIDGIIEHLSDSNTTTDDRFWIKSCLLKNFEQWRRNG